MKILAAVVTHNRAKLLQRCLIALEGQNRPAEEIVVINNGSTDNTSSIIKEFQAKEIRQENTGSAGGWFTAINHALENKFSHIWLMDDDGFPEKDALKNLAEIINEDFACLSSVVINEDNNNSFVFSYPLIKRNGKPNTLMFWKKYKQLNKLPLINDQYYPYAHLFNGALINIDAIKIIGNVSPEYFMYGDEVDYFFRLSTVGIVGSTPLAKHFHPNVMNREYSIKRIYYNTKNNLIIYRKYYDYPLLHMIIGPFIILARTYKTNGLPFTLSLIFGKNKKIFLKAINRGLSNKIGVDY